jgi:hypothetical protein
MADDSYPSPNHNSRAVSDTEYDTIVSPYVANGLIGTPADTSVIFGDSSGRVVKVRNGKFGLLRGRLWTSGGSTFSVSIAANATGSTRLDLIVLRYTRSSGDVRAAAITGTSPGVLPSPVNDASYFDLPLGSVTVTNGASIITGAQVVQTAWYLGPQRIVCLDAHRPPHAAGLPIYVYDTGDEFMSNGSSWTNPSKDSGWVAVSPAAGFTNPPTGYGCRLRSINGVAYLEVEVQRTGGAVLADTDVALATYGAAYAPSFQQPCVMLINANPVKVGYGAIRTDGTVLLTNHPGLATGNLITLQAVAFPVG